jgi:fucose permease
MTNRDKNIMLFAACGVIFAFGLQLISLGPILPALSLQTNTDLAVLGSLFTAIFLGALISRLAAGGLGDRIGMGAILFLGAVFSALGYLGISFSYGLPMLLGMGFFVGLGMGGLDLGANVPIAQIFETQSVSKVNLLHVFFGVGAVTGPALVSFSLRTLSTALLPLWFGSAILILFLPLLFWIARAQRFRVTSSAGAPESSPPGISVSILRSGLLWTFGFLLLLYMGMENGFGGWITTYMMRTTLLPIEIAALTVSIFWISMTCGRVVASAVGRRLAPMRLLAYSLAGTVLGSSALFWNSGNLMTNIFAVILMGFCFGPVYPTVMAVITSSFPNTPGKAVGIITATGSVGGMMLPWIMGILLANVSPAAFMGSMAGSALLAAGLLAVAGTFFRPAPEPQPIHSRSSRSA